ncbi:hypothetical protein PIB30_044694 [Stylosanthes scabra]|uniref:Uncharacterized protein n=1 Tax=Stylosanthes scabra TaxID=79078 RepID=A0ABU6SGW7_9FABA|nr:hypothetical protein [Stylosanthes scabra]
MREEIPSPPPSPKRKRVAIESSADPKRPRVLEGGSRDFCLLDRSFDVSSFIKCHLLRPRAQEILRDCDPIESDRWAEWAMVRAILNLQKVVLEEEKTEAEHAKVKAEGEEIKRLKTQESRLLSEVEKLRGMVTMERVRADLAEAFVGDLAEQCDELTEDAKGAIFATKGALKAQLAILVPDFDTSWIGFFKDIVDGKVIDPSD